MYSAAIHTRPSQLKCIWKKGRSNRASSSVEKPSDPAGSDRRPTASAWVSLSGRPLFSGPQSPGGPDLALCEFLVVHPPH